MPKASKKRQHQLVAARAEKARRGEKPQEEPPVASPVPQPPFHLLPPASPSSDTQEAIDDRPGSPDPLEGPSTLLEEHTPASSRSHATPRPTSPDPLEGPSTLLEEHTPASSQPHAAPGPSSLSRSGRKLQYFGRTGALQPPEVDPAVERVMCDVKQLDRLVSMLSCPVCNNTNCLSLNVSKRYGMSSFLKVSCGMCEESVSSVFSSARDDKSMSRPKPFVINEVCTLSSLLVGLGPYSFNEFCRHTELPGMHQRSFNKFAERVYSCNNRIGEEVFSKAAIIVRQEHQHTQADEVLDIAVSYDGSWLTRGHKSLIGIGCVIEILTGLVIDAHVMSLHCHVCAQTGEWIKRENPQRYDRWLAEHEESGECTKNFSGSSGMMEVKAAEVLWSRSVERHNFRYTSMISDGDSKAYNNLKALQPYGPGVEIVKEECLNHVEKRMGSALRNLVDDCRKRGITLGGRGHGRLTVEAIKKLQKYYGRAIRTHATVEEMRQAILASLYHGFSTDHFPQHKYCPPGPDSWCFYKKDVASHLYPGGHKERVHTPLNFDLLHKHIEPVYERLSSDALLKRCQLKTTQNPNESFHSLVWSRCNKVYFHSLKKVEFGVISAAADYNFGPAGITALKASLDIGGLGEHSQRLSQQKKSKRLDKSARAAQQKEKERRKSKAQAREKAQREAEKEHGPSYGSGMF